MERVWIVSEELHSRREALPANRLAEMVCVQNLDQLEAEMDPGERVLMLAPLPVLQKAQERFPKALAMQLLPPQAAGEHLLIAIRALLAEGRLQHDLEAAESVAWGGSGGGQFDDPSIEFLGAAILELSAARDMESVEKALIKACTKVGDVAEVKVHAYPDTASSRVIGLYQLAVPVHFQGALKAHIYARFAGDPAQALIDRVGEALLNLSDAVALAVERNLMISKAEETKTVWEASFDAVEDPVAILDDKFLVLRGNRAYGKFSGFPVERLQGKEPSGVDMGELGKLPSGQGHEWDLERGGRHYRAFFDTIQEPLGAGRYVLRFHDVTEERTLTEKILAKEQVAELGILVGSVAHEINNPIGGILAIGQILQKDLDPKSALGQDVENIVQSAERCRKIVQTMLSLVRKADEEHQSLNLGECLQSALDLLQGEVKRHTVRLKVSAGNAAPVVGNRNRLLQIFFHLLQQSLLAIGAKSGRQGYDSFLSIEVIPGFGNVEVRIEDNGDPVKHEYEIQSSVAFTVAKMILEEHEASYYFMRMENRNQQRIVFPSSGGA
ncbi:MAG TPA: histidine kinase dimerization/phospho-acceptor domain-containing protein [Bdellovibrionota bacterium]